MISILMTWYWNILILWARKLTSTLLKLLVADISKWLPPSWPHVFAQSTVLTCPQTWASTLLSVLLSFNLSLEESTIRQLWFRGPMAAGRLERLPGGTALGGERSVLFRGWEAQTNLSSTKQVNIRVPLPNPPPAVANLNYSSLCLKDGAAATQLPWRISLWWQCHCWGGEGECILCKEVTLPWCRTLALIPPGPIRPDILSQGVFRRQKR